MMLANAIAETPDAVPAVAPAAVLITNDAVVLGILMAILGLVFWTASSSHRFWKTFYAVFPMLLLCYFLPSLLTFAKLVDPEQSKLYFMASRYLLPASLVLLTISVDLREILKLGPKAIVMFLTGTVGVVLGGPLAILIVGSVRPDLVGGEDAEAVWRGLSTVAGSWIGGGANQAAMKEVFGPSDSLYSVMVAVDVIVAEIWMMFLLMGVGKADWIDAKLKADASSVRRLQEQMEEFSERVAKVPTATDLFVLLGVAFGVTAVSHAGGEFLARWIEANLPWLNQFSLNSTFFWLIVLATTAGVLLSFTKARQLEGVGASKIGTVFIFVLVATIGLKMDIRAIASHPGLFAVGGIWMAIHVALMIAMAWLIRAPYFFLAVGSKANIGGAASAPVVAAAFHPSLAPVGVLLAVLGYAVGTYGAYICAIMMQAVSAT
ncbi:hypothetical protein K239x_18450 [Planctomycetes bacterium K23_9]|uniref:DUF819 domain-containing protein n=2 Tax=Stieleria marina TaxID=1930275 RepID=A0A517NRY3_9BACT|nr:hypothetical protein K239x_18450 [Planctomycetes bacterium K23_9]